VLYGEATNTNFIVFGLTRLGLAPTIYPTQGEQTNQYNTDVVTWLHRRLCVNLVVFYQRRKSCRVRLANTVGGAMVTMGIIKYNFSEQKKISGFLQVLLFPSSIKLTTMILTEILLKVALNIITHNQTIFMIMKRRFLSKER
jgi:hypothetical protein